MKLVFRYLILSVISSLFLILIAAKISAQSTLISSPTPMVTTGSYAKACLTAKNVNPQERATLPIKDHDLKLTKSGLPTDRDIYIVGCITANDGMFCQTGNPSADEALKKLNFPIDPYKGHEFEVFGNNPFRTTDGNLSVFVHSSTHAKSMGHTFYAVFAGTVDQTGGQANTLQYGTFQLGQDPGKCVAIHWDPEGRVFDAQSLEPLPKTNVTLLDSNSRIVPETPPDPITNKCKQNKGVLKCPEKNPQVTDADGIFSYHVVDGIYYLQALKTSFSFPINLSEVHPNYTKAYWCDEPTKTYSLYTKPEMGTLFPIKVAGVAVHCDVPLKSISGLPYRADPQIVIDDNGSKDYGHTIIPGTTTVKYEGSFTHPFTKYTLTDVNTGKILIEGAADKNGDFEFLLDNAVLSNGNVLKTKLTWTKVDLTLNQPTGKNWSLFSLLKGLINSKSVYAQTTTVENNSITFEPIFTYIEGYAYDKLGKIIPNASVAVKVDNHNDPVYQTTADANGYFMISPNNLPTTNYYLEFTPPNSAVKIKFTTSQFAAANQSYLKSNNINLLTAAKNGKSLIPSLSPTAQVNTTLSPAVNNSQAIGSQYNLILMILMLVVLILVSGAIVIYIKKKESQTNNLPQ